MAPEGVCASSATRQGRQGKAKGAARVIDAKICHTLCAQKPPPHTGARTNQLLGAQRGVIVYSQPRAGKLHSALAWEYIPQPITSKQHELILSREGVGAHLWLRGKRSGSAACTNTAAAEEADAASRQRSRTSSAQYQKPHNCGMQPIIALGPQSSYV